jgi:tRNA threonylcarbamoyladenosine biosynthesis protein TsaB
VKTELTSNHTPIWLAMDTCGSSGSVALGLWTPDGLELLGERELAGRTYSTTLVPAVSDLLASARVGLNELAGMVVVHGPGSFTGVRVGLSTVKGLAEARRTPIVALSRLEVLSVKAKVPSSALDAQRGELYLRVVQAGHEARECLAGPSELVRMDPAPPRVGVCDDAAEQMLASSWPGTEPIRTSAPAARDALSMGPSRLAQGALADPAWLDGHYLRRPDAETFAQESPELLKP